MFLMVRADSSVFFIIQVWFFSPKRLESARTVIKHTCGNLALDFDPDEVVSHMHACDQFSFLLNLRLNWQKIIGLELN